MAILRSSLSCVLCVAAVGLGAATPASAAIIFFTDRAAWQAAAGASSFTEDFEGFAADTVFRTSAVALNGMSIQQTGTNQSFRNQVDVPGFANGDNNGTAGASMYTNAAEGGDPGTHVRITFNSLNAAFGGESNAAADGEGVVLAVFDGAIELGSHVLAGGLNDFLGYVLTAGDVATSVSLRSNTVDPGLGGEGFWYDNLAGVNAVAAPEPASLALLALGLVGLGWQRGRKARSGKSL